METTYPKIVQKIHKEFFANTTTGKSVRLYNQGFVKAIDSVSGEITKRQSYYQQKYPLYKFITKKQVEAICKKYGLIIGKIKWYKGFVPETKLNLIENFHVDDIDCVKYYEDYGEISYTKLPEKVKEFFSTNSKNSFIVNKGLIYKEYIYYQRRRQKMVIVAPTTQFDIPEGYEIKKHKIKKEVQDPIVLQKVKGGYLIIAAWGDEASDNEIVNPINN